MSPNRVVRPLVAADRSGVFRILENAGNFTPAEVHQLGLSQVAGHDLPVLKGLPPLVLEEQDIETFAEALDDVIAKAARPARVAGLALRAARAR